MGAVTVRAATASLNLSYQLVAGEGSAVAVDEVVNLRSTKTSLAGIRRWFECPGCHRRSRILYGPRFRRRILRARLLARWATYRRLEAQEVAADEQWMAADVARFGRSKERRKP